MAPMIKKRIARRPRADRRRSTDAGSRYGAQLRILKRVQTSVARLGEPLAMLQAVTGAIREAAPDLAIIARLASWEGREITDVAPREDKSPAASRIEIAIVGQGGEVGTLAIDSPKDGAFGQGEVATFEMVASILGGALDTLRLLERVEREKHEWASTFDAITDMVSIHDDAFRLLRGNRALLERASVPAYDLTGRTCQQVYAQIAGLPVECPHMEAERTRRAASKEILRPDGVSFLLTALPRFEAGRHTYSVHLCEEITEARRLRDQLLQSEKMSAVGQLVSGVAHELNNPLAGVMGYTQLIMTRPLDAKLRSDLERVFGEAQRAAKIVQNLLTFARKHKPERRFLGLNGIVEKTLEMRAYELRVSNIEVETDLDPDLPRTLLDFHQMQQVILNIVTNAEQAMLEAHGRGRLAIGSRAPADRIVLRIEDDGPGIPPENRQKVFDPFFTTKPVGKGTGLGLSICDGIVKEHGGTLRVESAPGGGTAFIVELPILKADEPRPPEPKLPPQLPRVQGRSILVVDDEASIQDFLVEILTRDGYQVDTAGSGTSALAKMERRAYDLVISDLKMPGMSGAELYDTIRSTRPGQAGRILFTSGDTLSPTTDAFLRRHGHSALIKPFTFEDLRAALDQFFAATR